jgi:DNA polymerase III delta prime subunit
MESIEIKNKIIKSFNENINSHAFLFVTNNIGECYKEIKDIVKIINCPSGGNDDCKICHTIESETNPDYIVIKTEEKEIKKDIIEMLMDNFKTMPLMNKYKIYTIVEANKLNASSANKLLKFLEEPESNIVGFYITDNLQSVLPTIKSRCEIINYRFGADNILSVLNITEEDYGNYFDTSAQLIGLLEDSPKYKLMAEAKSLKEKERYEILNIFELIRKIYIIKFENVVNKEYNNLNYVKILLDVVGCDDINLLSKRIKCLDEIISDMQCNVNKELVINKFFLIWE